MVESSESYIEEISEQQFNILGELGSGTFGVVKLGVLHSED